MDFSASVNSSPHSSARALLQENALRFVTCSLSDYELNIYFFIAEGVRGETPDGVISILMVGKHIQLFTSSTAYMIREGLYK